MSTFTLTVTDHGTVTTYSCPTLRAALRLRKRMLRRAVAVALSTR